MHFCFTKIARDKNEKGKGGYWELSMNTTKSERKRIRNRNKRNQVGGNSNGGHHHNHHHHHHRITGVSRNIRRLRQRRMASSSSKDRQLSNKVSDIIQSSFLSAELDLVDDVTTTEELHQQQQQQEDNFAIASIAYHQTNEDNVQATEQQIDQICMESTSVMELEETADPANNNKNNSIILNDHQPCHQSHDHQILTMDQLQCISSTVDMSSTDFAQTHHQILNGGNEVN